MSRSRSSKASADEDEPAARRRPGPGPVEKATRALLRKLRVSVQTEPLAAGAVAVAKQVDEATTQTGTAAAHRELRQALREVDEFVARRMPEPEKPGEKPAAPDLVDELAARRPAAGA